MHISLEQLVIESYIFIFFIVTWLIQKTNFTSSFSMTFLLFFLP